MKILGMISVTDPHAFEVYRSQVGATINAFGGKVITRGNQVQFFWNELECAAFDAFVEIEFPDSQAANAWAESPDYQALLPVRSKAMRLTLIGLG
jgi:uncharacterized protein (DUF1330 family)